MGSVVYRHMDSKACITAQKRKGKIASSPKQAKTTMLSFCSRKQKVPKAAVTVAQPAVISVQTATHVSTATGKLNSGGKDKGAGGQGLENLSDPAGPVITDMPNSPRTFTASLQKHMIRQAPSKGIQSHGKVSHPSLQGLLN